ncbi:DUF305 domain-containing protein [Brevundimonas sp.]|uniref:DUF305 domain-containing protein n=1 Tax=Brevundimonas sp. TaxID=1871086 RepID=UPI0027379147|nr:DUF305 domain-containing protein [Brevundimonas sp.]MDP3801289.1 DUF305 domain-containing protein [Brevundimonas sp.]
MRPVPIILLAALTLAACDGGGDPVQQALRETAAANHSAAIKETATPVAPEPTSMERAWVAEMVEHHRETIATADAALAQSRDPEVRRMAQAVRDARAREIAELQAWKPAAAPGQ